jgi:hypothetical protein
MASRTLTFFAVVLTLAFLADTGWQVSRLTQNLPTSWYGLTLLVPIVLLLKKLSGNQSQSAANRTNTGTAAGSR